MTDKSYINGSRPCLNINQPYNPPTSQTAQEIQQRFYSYNMPTSTAYNYPTNQSSNNNQLLDAYNFPSEQQINQKAAPNQNVYNMYQSNDFTWENRINEETLKIPDKIELVEISGKDLSPAISYCSNLDGLIPDLYKTNYFTKNNEPQWNVNSYLSCAQNSTPETIENNTVKYCSIQSSMQKNKNFDNSMPSCYLYQEQNNFQQVDYTSTNLNYNNCNYEKVTEENNYFSMNEPPISDHFIEQDSNDESDIIVEDSDEEFDVGYRSKLQFKANCCIICNIGYTRLGTQFYLLTLKSPLTMSTQKPVYLKIINIIRQTPKENSYVCSACLGLINTIDHLQLKLQAFNQEIMDKFRNTCLENNVSLLNRKINVKRKSAINAKLKCRKCRIVISMKKLCQNHSKIHRIAGILCEWCGKISSSRRKHSIHTKMYHFIKQKRKIDKISAYSCSNCFKLFRTKSNKLEHENYCLNFLPHACPNCDKKFPSSTKLKNHIKLKHDKKFKAICSICNIGFIKLSDYKSHKISHSTDKKFVCTKCDKAYKTLSNLNFHMKAHKDRMPFNCDVCGKGFMRKEYYEAHINNHNGIKNYPCTICDKRFVSQKNLDSHLKYHDGSLKRKKCNICGKMIASGFEEHLRIHDNIREFECDECENRFNTKSTLAKHKKRKHVPPTK